MEKLLYFGSYYIKEFVTKHPIEWHTSRRNMANRGGAGNLQTPTSAIGEFIRLLKCKSNLFTQKEFTRHCWARWGEWIATLTDDNKFSKLEKLQGLQVRLERNFYPSFIDSLYVWSILSEAHWFDVCYIDALKDAYSKVDLVLIRGNEEFKIALLGPYRATIDRRYKKKNRGNRADYDGVIEIVMPSQRTRNPGNKRWFELKDFWNIKPKLVELPKNGNQYYLTDEVSRFCGG